MPGSSNSESDEYPIVPFHVIEKDDSQLSNNDLSVLKTGGLDEGEMISWMHLQVKIDQIMCCVVDWC